MCDNNFLLQFLIIIFQPLSIFTSNSNDHRLILSAFLNQSLDLMNSDLIVVGEDWLLTSGYKPDLLSIRQVSFGRTEQFLSEKIVAYDIYRQLVLYFHYDSLGGSILEIIKSIGNISSTLTTRGQVWNFWILESLGVESQLKDNNDMVYEISKEFQMNKKLRLISENNSNNYNEIYWIKEILFIKSISFENIYSHCNGGFVNFNGAIIKATASESRENDPVVTYEESLTPKFKRGLGVFDLWDLKDMLNFKVEAMKGDEMEVTEMGPTGYGYQLMTGEADVSILHTVHIVENVRHLTPLTAMGEDGVYAIFRQPPSFAVRNAFTKPFSGQTWLMIVIIWIMIIISISIIYFTSIATHCVQIDDQQQHRWKWDFSGTGLWATSIFCQRSFFWYPSSTPLRIMLLFGLIWSLVIYSLYSAQIISSFTAEFLPIRSLTDLLTNNFKVVSDPEQFYSYFLTSHESNDAFDIELKQNYKSGLETFKEVSSGFTMTFDTLDSICLFARQLNYSDREICDIYHYIPLGSVTLKSGFFVPKNSPFKEPFNLKLIGIIEKGLNGRYIRNYYQETIVKCPKGNTRYREDLGMSDVFSAFAILFGGFGIAMLQLNCEIIIVRQRHRK